MRTSAFAITPYVARDVARYFKSDQPLSKTIGTALMIHLLVALLRVGKGIMLSFIHQISALPVV